MANIWTNHVRKTYAKMKKDNPKVTLKQAIKEAKKTYKKPTAWQKENWRELY